MRAILFAATALSALVVVPHAQQRPSAPAASSSRIELPVTVLDTRSALVTGLAADRFRLYVDDELQQIASVSGEERPAGIAMLLGPLGEPSPEREARRTAIREAMLQFSRTIHPETDLALQLQFSESSSPFQTARQPFPVGSFRLLKAGDHQTLEQILEGGRGIPGEKSVGQLAQWPVPIALYAGASLVQRTARARRVILYFGNGTDLLADVAAVNHLSDAYSQLAEARRNGIEIYAVGVFPSSSDYFRWRRGRKPDPTALDKLADDTGGASAIAPSAAALMETVERFAQEISAAYTLTFDSPVRDQKFHRVRVEVDGGYTVRTRPGFTRAAH